MTSVQPDLSTLPARMRWAAGVLIEVGTELRCRGIESSIGASEKHSPDRLRGFATAWEAEERVKAEREQMVERLIRDLQSAASNNFGLEAYIGTAKHLIAAGWTKATPA